MKKWKQCCCIALSAMMVASNLQIPSYAVNTSDKIAIATLTAESEYSGNPIGKANDGDPSTFWESNWKGSDYTPSETDPIEVIATFDQMTEVGIMRIVQRKGNDTNAGQPNGRFIKARYTKLGENNEPIGEPITQTYGTAGQIPSDADIDVEINATVKGVKIEILQAYHTTVTMAELEFYAPDAVVENTNGIAAIEANTEQTSNNQGIEKAIDGDPATFWHSAWTGFTVSETNPAVVTITRTGTEPMAELVYTTRPYKADGDLNGNIMKMKVYTSNNKSTWKELTDVSWSDATGTKSVNMAGNADKYIKLEITKGFHDNATAAEFKIVNLGGIDQIDTSLMDTVRELGLAEGKYQGWEAVSAKAVLDAFNVAQSAYDSGNASALIVALSALQTAYDGLIVDKQPLLDKIEEARQVDRVGKNPASIAMLNTAIANAVAAVDTVKTPLDVAFEVTQLSEAMLLSDDPVKDIQNLTGLKDLQRENNFNEGWLFRETTTEAKEVTMDESQFSSINLPHDFSIDNDFTVSGEAESAFLLGGTGWYRKHVVIPEEAQGSRFNLVFDGAYMDTTVYVNGTEVGQNHNGYNQFAFDITEELVCDGTTDNVIAVKVVNDLPSSRWYSGSGIYRDVTLQVTNETHVDYLGMFVAPNPSGEVTVTNAIVGRKDNTKVKTVIYDKDNQKVAESEMTDVSADKVTQTLTVSSPELWTVKVSSPALYKAVTTVYNGEAQVDQTEERFGFKTVAFDRETGFSLNGEKMKLKGVCMHHDQGALGAAANYHAIFRQMKIMKDMGANSIRVTHNPASEALLRACDELGILVINEAFDHFYYSKNNNYNDFARWFKVAIGENGPEGSAASMKWGEYVARQMVKVSRNHASILMYSVGNELLEGGGSDDGYIRTVADVCGWFADEDPYHKPTIGDNKAKSNDARALSMCDEVSKAGGIVGLNYTVPSQYEALRAKYPNWIIYGSETSSANHSRDVYNTEYKDGDRLLCSDYENESARVGWGHSASTAWKHVEENNWNLGEYVWTGFDYLGEPTPWNGIGVGSVSGKGAVPRSSFFGIVETTGFEKDIYYLYQSLWNDDVHTLHMTDAWNDSLMKSGDKVTVQVFSDAKTVKLYPDGEEIGSMTSTVKENGQRKFGDKYFAEFKVNYTPGTISVKAFDENGDEITDAVGTKQATTTERATKTKLTANKNTLECDGYDLSYVTVDLCDENNHFVPDNNQKLVFTLEGEGRIVGVDNGNQSDAQSFRVDDPMRATRSAFNGKALVIIQSTKRAGEIKLHVKGAGLKENVITLNSSATSTETGLSALELVSKYATVVNQEVVLPETVTGILENGESRELAVAWDLTTLDITKAGSYTVKGKVDGYDAYATVTVTVYDEFEAAANYTTVMHEGSVMVLPETRKVYYANGEVAGEFPVVWEYYNVSDYESGNTYTVNGTILVAGVRMPVIAKIRVEEALPEARNLARLGSDMPTLAQSCVNTADNLNALNNGVTVSTAANQRWTDWAQQDVKVPWVSYTWNNKYTVSDVVAYVYQDASSVIPKALEFKLETLNDAGEWVEQKISYITPIAYNDGDGKTTINLAEPVKTNGIRLHLVKPAVNTFTGLTELEVFEYVAKETPKDNSLMTGIKLDNASVENFDSEVYSYEITVDEYPTLADMSVVPEGIDATASCVVLKDEEAHTVRVIVRAENGEESTYTFSYMKKEVVSKEELKTAIEDAEKFNEKDYTAESWSTFADALAAAKDVLEDPDATQEEVNTALGALLSAAGELKAETPPAPVDKTDLNKEIKNAEKLNEKDYTAESWKLFKEALASAKEVSADGQATQSQVTYALNALKAAVKALKPVVPENPNPEQPDPENPDTENPGTENPGTENPGTENPTDSTNPGEAKTGDTANGTGWLILMAGCICVLLMRRKVLK